ncbi:unnamed protein product [Candidula unifasciata]|uniref:Major facilitator superfamily (MFS) profile domain-containing protein n=1 Tax=Candidula unifasciata TaxID=100452 RepID=A0A8S3ZZJ7_9EUPU|nr:unnamed protein product [Candidula unifasciata]
MSEYEAVLEQIKAFGPFQVRTFILVSLFEAPLAWAMLVPMFTADKPRFFCTTPQANNQSSELTDLNNTYMQEPEVCSANSSTCLGIEFDSEFTSIVSEWHLICKDSYVGELITSIQMAGVLIGALVTGQLADIFGRKKVLFAEYALLIVFWFSTAFAQTWQVYAALRFIVGGLVGGCLVVNFVLPLEFVTPKWRTFCGCIGFWAVGLMLLAPWAYFLRDWRLLNIAMASTSLTLLPLWWFVDESPRWLLSRGRIQEAGEIIVKAASFNKRPVPDLVPLQEFVKREQIRRDEQKKYSYWHLCSSFHLAMGTLICMFGWFVSSSVYYGHNFNSKNLAGDRYLNVFISGLVEIPALIFVLYSNNTWGRRRTVFLLMLLSGLACFSILIIDLTDRLKELSALTITMAMIGKSCIAGAWAAVQILSAETFPTVIRNIGIGACSMAARIGGIVAPQFVFMGEKSKPVPFVIFGVLAVLCSLLMLLLTETVGRPLPDRLHSETENNLSASLQCEILVTDTSKTDRISHPAGNGFNRTDSAELKTLQHTDSL